MSTVDITIHGKTFPISCDDGEEGHLQMLAERVNGRVAELSRSLVKGGDMMLMVATALMMEDELLETKKQLETLKSMSAAPRNGAANEVSGGRELEARAIANANAALSQAIIGIAEYVENIANKVENA